MKKHAVLFLSVLLVFLVPLTADAWVRWSWGLGNLPSVVVQNPTGCWVKVDVNASGVVRPLGGEILGGAEVAVSPRKQEKQLEKNERRVARGKLPRTRPARYWNPVVLVPPRNAVSFQVEQHPGSSRVEVAILATPYDGVCYGDSHRTVSFYYHPIHSDPYRRNQQRTVTIGGIRPVRR